MNIYECWCMLICIGWKLVALLKCQYSSLWYYLHSLLFTWPSLFNDFLLKCWSFWYLDLKYSVANKKIPHCIKCLKIAFLIIKNKNLVTSLTCLNVKMWLHSDWWIVCCSKGNKLGLSYLDFSAHEHVNMEYRNKKSELAWSDSNI